jgi:hypothetical protein
LLEDVHPPGARHQPPPRARASRSASRRRTGDAKVIEARRSQTVLTVTTTAAGRSGSGTRRWSTLFGALDASSAQSPSAETKTSHPRGAQVLAGRCGRPARAAAVGRCACKSVLAPSRALVSRTIARHGATDRREVQYDVDPSCLFKSADASCSVHQAPSTVACPGRATSRAYSARTAAHRFEGTSRRPG